jgi:DNA-binding transcriptional regulator YhcF (GntR family)
MSRTDAGSAPAVSVAAERTGFKAELDGLGFGFDEIAAEAARPRYLVHPGQAGPLAGGQTSERAAARPGAPGAAGVPGFRLVIGVDSDPREWVRIANALLERIASGAVRAGSRVPPVTSLGLEFPLAPGTTGRAFRELASEGVLHWVPGLGYHVRASITVAVSDRARQDGRLRAVLPAVGQRQQAAPGVTASSGAGRR